MSDATQPGSANWIKREVSLGNVLLMLTMMGGIASAVVAGTWQGSRINSTLQGGIEREAAVRVEQNRALSDQMQAFGVALNDVRQDVRQVHTDVMTIMLSQAKGSKP